MPNSQGPRSFSNKCSCVNIKTNFSGSQNWPFIDAVKHNLGSSTLSMAHRCATKIKTTKSNK